MLSGTPVGHDVAMPPLQLAVVSGVQLPPEPASSGMHANCEVAGTAVHACDPLPEQSNAVSPWPHVSTDPLHAEGGPPSAHDGAPPAPHTPPVAVVLHASPQSAQFSPRYPASEHSIRMELAVSDPGVWRHAT